MTAPTIWLVIRVGVYDQGVCLATPDRAEALRFAESHAPDLDGYHSWRVEEVPLGVPHAGEASQSRHHGIYDAAAIAEAEARMRERRRLSGHGATLDPTYERRLADRVKVVPLEP